MERLSRWALQLFHHAKRTLLVGSANGREEAFDVARAFAIIGMVFINFPYMLARRDGVDGASAALTWIVHIPSGRASSLFVTLAGVGVSMLARRAYRAGDWKERLRAIRTLLLRAACLLPAGVLLHDVWNIDILHFYGVYLTLAALLFVFAPTFVLALSALVLIAVGVVLDVVSLGLPDAPFLSPLGFLIDVFIDGVHPVFPWLSFLLYGLWLGRQDFTRLAWRRRLMALAVVLFGVFELTSLALTAWLLLHPVPLLNEYVGLLGTSWTPDPLYVLSALCTATFVITLSHELLAFAQRHQRAHWLRPLISTGQLALSIYVAHALIGVVIPVRLGAGRALSIEQVAAYAAAFLVCVVAMATLYRFFFARGPLEWLMRMVSTVPAREGRVLTVDAPVLTVEGAVLTVEGAVLTVEGAVLTVDAPVSPVEGAVSPVEGAVSPARSRLTTRALAVLGLVLACVVFAARITGGARASEWLRPGTTLSSLSLLHPRDVYKLTLAQPAHVTFTTRSGLDLFLELHEGTRFIAEDDDSGPGLDAEIEADLQPGTYEVLVRPFASTTGPYVLDVHF